MDDELTGAPLTDLARIDALEKLVAALFASLATERAARLGVSVDMAAAQIRDEVAGPATASPGATGFEGLVQGHTARVLNPAA